MIYVMSDLHGCYDEFIEMLKEIEFSKTDELYIIGDVVDRGPEPIKLFKYIMNKQNIHTVMGNHEKMMIDALTTPYYKAHRLWYINGGEITEKQFNRQGEETKKKIIKYIKNLPYYAEVNANGKNYVLIHGGPEWNFEEALRLGRISSDVLWNRFDTIDKKEVVEGKIIVVGHTPVQLYNFDNIIKFADKRLIDCGCVFGHKLACLRLNDEKEYYIESKQKTLKRD